MSWDEFLEWLKGLVGQETKINVVRRLRVRNTKGGSKMDKTFTIAIKSQEFPEGTVADHYAITVTGPEAQSASIPYDADPLAVVLSFTVPGIYDASAVLVDINAAQLGDSGLATFEITGPTMVTLNVVSGLQVS